MEQRQIAYVLYLAALLLALATIGVTPWLALHGPREIAALFYNAYIPTCHQWIYRSDCLFFDGSSHRIGECIPRGREQEVRIATEFTSSPKNWDGAFVYSRDQIGLNRAEKAEYPGELGYKFPNDARNIGIYLGMFLLGIILPFRWKNPRVPRFAVFVAGILPVAIDGFGQMAGFWESTNAVRFATGAIAGMTVSAFAYAMLYEEKKRKEGVD